MYKKDLALNTLQWLICHKTKPNQTKPNLLMLTLLSVDEILLPRYLNWSTNFRGLPFNGEIEP